MRYLECRLVPLPTNCTLLPPVEAAGAWVKRTTGELPPLLRRPLPCCRPSCAVRCPAVALPPPRVSPPGLRCGPRRLAPQRLAARPSALRCACTPLHPPRLQASR